MEYKETTDKKAELAGLSSRKGNPLAISLVIVALTPIIIITAIIGSPIMYERCMRQVDTFRAQRCYDRADERIEYDNSLDMHGRIFDTPMYGATMLLDYDEMRISFVYPAYTHDVISSYKLGPDTRMETYPLNPVESVSSDHIQFVCPLSAPGEEVIAYFEDGSDPSYSMTKGVSVKMQDGTLWYVDVGEDVGLDASLILELASAIISSDTMTAYGHNNADDGTLFPPYAAGITRDSFGLNHETMIGYLITSQGGRTWEQLGYVSPYGVVRVASLIFEPYKEEIPGMIQCPRINLENGEYMVPYYIENHAGDFVDGILLYTADGKAYNAEAYRHGLTF